MRLAIEGQSIAISKLLELISDCPPISPKQRLQIYSYECSARFESVLAEDFPRVKALLGENRFGLLVRGYLEDYPSRSANLYDFGFHLSKFLSDYPDDQMPFLSDVAAMEWAECEAWLTTEGSFLQADGLARLLNHDPDSLYLVPSASLRLCELSWPVETLWEVSVEQGASLPPSWIPDSHTVTVHWAFDGTRVKRIPIAEKRVLQAMVRGESLSRVAEQGAELGEEGFGKTLQKWVCDRVIIGAEIKRRT